jgi:hypothetical protein
LARAEQPVFQGQELAQVESLALEPVVALLGQLVLPEASMARIQQAVAERLEFLAVAAQPKPARVLGALAQAAVQEQ